MPSMQVDVTKRSYRHTIGVNKHCNRCICRQNGERHILCTRSDSSMTRGNQRRRDTRIRRIASAGGGPIIDCPSSTINTRTKMIFMWSCALLSLSTLIDASSNSGSSAGSAGNAAFFAVSEITLQSTTATDPISNESGAGVDNAAQSSHAGENSDSSSVDAAVNSGASSETGVQNNDQVNSNTDEQLSETAGSGSSGSDTDGEDDDNLNNEISDNGGGFSSQNGGESTPSPITTTESASSSSSQPLRTLKRLQAMLDDTDYATHTVASSSAPSIINAKADGESVVETIQASATSPNKGQQSSNNPPKNDGTPEKLWTSKDRAKYRRTRRTEKQRQQAQQRVYEEHHARKMRDVQRLRIIREERERKELEELRRKQAEVLERQKYEQQKRQQMQNQFLHYDESTDVTDDDTDTDGGKGFELPNLPVYLSDAEQTDDFSEEADDKTPKMQQQSRPIRPNHIPQNLPQGYQMPPPNNMEQGNPPQQYQQYNYQDMQQQQHPQRPNNGPYQNYRQQYPPYQQQQQQPQQQTIEQQYQYGPNHQHTVEENQRRQYEQQYATWAQAAANGYYYPPPPHPAHGAQQQQAQQQQEPPRQFAPQYPYTTQQQQSHGSYPQQQPPYHGQNDRAYSSIPPQQRQASFQPRTQQGSQTAPPYQDRKEQPDFSRGKDKGTDKWEALQRQHQQQDEQRSIENEDASTDSTTPATSEDVSVKSTQEQVATPNNTTAIMSASSIDSSQMGVKSAFVATTSPLISPIPTSRLAAPINAEGPYCELEDESAVLIAGAKSRISFDSIQKLSFSTLGVALLSYCAVSPRSLPVPEYNRLFLQNLSVVWLAAVAPVFVLLSIFDGKHSNINTAIGTFHVSFTLGYALCFISEIIVTTVVRLGVFKIWEPAIFSLTPEVPSIILPWVLREKQYKPKRITLFAADFGASCVASPIIEEYLKLKIVQWTCKLPRNFKHSSKKVQPSRRRKKKQKTLQPVRSIDMPQVTNINCYVTQMLAASLGLKLCDVTRRILMYTKQSDDFKRVYAVCRGTFPIHELCGTMTALLLARRDVIGVNLPLWKILGPAVFIHGMANFRGMKPIFKWSSSTPWSEMQLNQLKEGNDYVWKQLLPKSYSKLVWLTILFRVYGFCVKNYYLLGRQAMKRATTYSGKLYAFDAKLQTDSVLKKAKDK